MDYQFQRHRIDKISKGKILKELEKAAQKYNYEEFGWRDFNKIATITRGPVVKEFGTWRKALKALKEYLNSKGLDLCSRKMPYNRTYSDKQLFEEMERIWTDLNHRPSRLEWESADPKISYNTYRQRFDGWQNACLKFIEHKMGGSVLTDIELAREPLPQREDQELGLKPIIINRNRSVALNVRLKVLDRDNYRCVLCGRSPATDVGVRLHIDHRIPFSKGGPSTIDNLQTLCQDCNLGKSDQVIGSAKL